LAAVGKPAIKKLYEHYLEKGFTSDFAKCVEQAAKDLQLDESGDPDDLANMPDQAWD
jgi:hypothetical protein